MTAVSLSVLVILFGSALHVLAQASDAEPQQAAGIQDNSFLIEEAYNQEEGVVQHISNFLYAESPERSLTYVFTQEWPAGGQLHQISYTVPYGSQGGNHGLGDVLVNYRYQLFANGDRAYVSPRLSVILPTGSESEGLGEGVVGVQFNVPASKELSRAFVVHANAGGTIIPKTKLLVSYYAGVSLIWRAMEDFHLLFENLVSSHAGIDDGGDVVREATAVINPGVRCALNFQDLQVVPGLGFPVSIHEGETTISLFFYLSFEHPL